MVPGDQLAARIEPGLKEMRRHRTELAEGNIFLPAPNHLDGLAHRFGETDRIMHDVLF
jgi:hypothetical protein